MAMSWSQPPNESARFSFYAFLAPVPVVCFLGALVTDIVYWRTAEMMWADFSAWLVTAGVMMGVLAGIGALFDLIAAPRRTNGGALWPIVLGYSFALVLAIFNMLVHSRDAWTSVVPTGLILSASVVMVLALTRWMEGILVKRRGRRVAP